MEALEKDREFVSKEEIRQTVWDHLEQTDQAASPRPVHQRIPNYQGAGQAALLLAGLQEFREARRVKVNPDKPQEEVRWVGTSQRQTKSSTALGIHVQ